MRKALRYILLGLLVAIVAIQFVPVDRANPPVDEALELDAPPEVQAILERSCYDCHSNRTSWPFYSYIAPISWLVAHDVEEGREEMNLSEWYAMPAQRQIKLRHEIADEVLEEEMPLPIYLITHSDARISENQKQLLKEWSGADDDS